VAPPGEQLLDMHWFCDSQTFNVGSSMFSGLTGFKLAPFAAPATTAVNNQSASQLAKPSVHKANNSKLNI